MIAMPATEQTSRKRAFERTALPHLDNLYGAAMRLTKNPDAANDLVQESMVRAWRFWDSFQPGTNVKAWLFTILRNTFINEYHRNARRSAAARELAPLVDTVGPTAAAHAQSEAIDLDDALDLGAINTKIGAALSKIPADYRDAVLLADFEGLSYKEIAETTGAPIGTVMSRIYRGRQLLHGLLHAHALEAGIVTDRDPPAGWRETKFTRNRKPAQVDCPAA